MSSELPSDPDLERVLEQAPQPHSVPPSGLEPRGCREHGAAFVRVDSKFAHDTGEPLGNWMVFEDGCEEPL